MKIKRMKIQSILLKLVILFVGLFLGIFVGNYNWGHKTTERFCYKCGKTEMFEEEKSIFHLDGKVSNQLFQFSHFLSAYLDDPNSCNHHWNSYNRFPVILDRLGEDALKDRLSSIYWYKWLDLNQSVDFQRLIINMAKNNRTMTKEFLQVVFDPNKLIAIEDVMPLFEQEILWQKKWEKWETFKANYQVTKQGDFMQAVYNCSDSTQIITWSLKEGSYTKTPIDWVKQESGNKITDFWIADDL